MIVQEIIPRKKFRLHVDYFEEPRGRIWMVRVGNRLINARHVWVHVPVETHFKGIEAKQPRAYITGVGVVHVLKGGLVIIR